MVGLVFVSHSEKIAEGVRELSLQMAQDAKIASVGGTDDGRLGTEPGKIVQAINEVYSEDGVIVLFDLGSAYMNAEMALEFLDEDKRLNVEIVDAAIVEGAIVATVESSMGKNINEIKHQLKNLKLGKM